MRHCGPVPARNQDQNDTKVERVDPLLGTVLNGKYRLDLRLAAGGFGAIYQASHVETGDELAVKVVHARHASDPGIVARFKREGEALTALRSVHTIAAYELGETDDGVLFIAMELLRGATLYERLRDDGPVPWRRMVEIAIGVCHSLAEAHALGVVHRDLKPTNIYLERRKGEGEVVKVLDFGIAKILQHSQFDNSDLTSAGLMIGTIDYMSPEQMVGGEITGASDLYTLGIVIYEMIAGQRPFPAAPSAASVLAAMLKPPPSLASVAIVPAELDRIVMRCLERDAADRYQTADELAADLRRLLETHEARPRTYDPDDDATQIAPARVVTSTRMAAAAPPPSVLATAARPAPEPPRSAPSPSSPPPLPPAVTSVRPGPTPPPPLPPRATAPLAITPRRATPVPSMPAGPPMPSGGSAPGIALPPPGAVPPPGAFSAPGIALPPPGAFSAPGIALPPPGPGMTPVPPGPGMTPVPRGPGMTPAPGMPIQTLRGMPMAPGRAGPDATAIDASPRRNPFDPARDAMVRRFVWVCVIVLVSVIAAVVAAVL
jgi:serine/threonine-protein kinase